MSMTLLQNVLQQIISKNNAVFTATASKLNQHQKYRNINDYITMSCEKLLPANAQLN